MPIKVGDRLPDGTLTEFIEQETPGCTVGPNAFQVADLTKGKKIVVFGLPGAFTPTCSAKHVPSYVTHIDKLRSKGIDEVWCVSVNAVRPIGWLLALTQGCCHALRSSRSFEQEFE